MKKVKLEVKIPSNKKVDYNGTVIEITPFLGFTEQAFLINNYLEDYFEESTEIPSLLIAECNMKNYILQSNTNINVENLDNNIYVDADLWDLIQINIANWQEFRFLLDSIVAEKQRQISIQNSIGNAMLVLFEKAHDLLGKLENITPEGIDKAREAGFELIQKLQESSLLGENISPKSE